MQATEFDELAGRIEGVARMVMHLVARLEETGAIDGPAMAEGLRRAFVITEASGPVVDTAQRTLNEVATALDEAREWRRFMGRIAG